MSRPSQPPLYPTDIRKAAFHEAGHAVVAARSAEWVQFCILPPEAVERTPETELLGTIGGQINFTELQNDIESAAVAWAGFFAEGICVNREAKLTNLSQEAQRVLPELAPLDWRLLQSLSEGARDDGAKLAYQTLEAEWKTVTREAELLIRFYAPPDFCVRSYEKGRGWH